MTNLNLEQRFLTANECADYLRLSPLTVRRFCKRIGAEKKIGSRCIYDRKVIDDYLAKNDVYEKGQRD